MGKYGRKSLHYSKTEGKTCIFSFFFFLFFLMLELWMDIVSCACIRTLYMAPFVLLHCLLLFSFLLLRLGISRIIRTLRRFRLSSCRPTAFVQPSLTVSVFFCVRIAARSSVKKSYIKKLFTRILYLNLDGVIPEGIIFLEMLKKSKSTGLLSRYRHKWWSKAYIFINMFFFLLICFIMKWARY